MRHWLLLVFVASALLGVCACTNPIASRSGPGLLAGNWHTTPFVPSGSGIHLWLATNGPVVTGTGQEYALQYLKDSFAITGSQALDATFRLTFTSDSGTVATCSGHMVGSNEFRIEWGLPLCPSPSGCEPDSLTFARQPQ